MAKKYHLKLKGYVGGYDFDSDYVDYVLGKHADGEVEVLIDSLGGSLATALSIAAAFKNHGKVNVHFVGMNASAATIASLGAKRISIDKNAFYLVHKVSNLVFEWDSKNADEMQAFIDKLKQMKTDLDKMDGSVAEMYAARCQKSASELLELMKVGGWLTAKEAKEWGFVDEVTEDDTKAPALTSQTVASLQAAGIPVPNLPVTDGGQDGFFEKMRNLFMEMFGGSRKVAEPETRKVNENNKPTIKNTMKKTLNFICAVLALEALAFEDGKAEMSEEQLDKVEAALKENDETIAGLKAQIQAKDEEIEALKAAPGAETKPVVEAKGKSEQGAERSYFETTAAAQELYEMLP